MSEYFKPTFSGKIYTFLKGYKYLHPKYVAFPLPLEDNAKSVTDLYHDVKYLIYHMDDKSGITSASYEGIRVTTEEYYHTSVFNRIGSYLFRGNEGLIEEKVEVYKIFNTAVGVTINPIEEEEEVVEDVEEDDVEEAVVVGDNVPYNSAYTYPPDKTSTSSYVKDKYNIFSMGVELDSINTLEDALKIIGEEDTESIVALTNSVNSTLSGKAIVEYCNAKIKYLETITIDRVVDVLNVFNDVKNLMLKRILLREIYIVMNSFCRNFLNIEVDVDALNSEGKGDLDLAKSIFEGDDKVLHIAVTREKYRMIAALQITFGLFMKEKDNQVLHNTSLDFMDTLNEFLKENYTNAERIMDNKRLVYNGLRNHLSSNYRSISRLEREVVSKGNGLQLAAIMVSFYLVLLLETYTAPLVPLFQAGADIAISKTVGRAIGKAMPSFLKRPVIKLLHIPKLVKLGTKKKFKKEVLEIYEPRNPIVGGVARDVIKYNPLPTGKMLMISEATIDSIEAFKAVSFEKGVKDRFNKIRWPDQIRREINYYKQRNYRVDKEASVRWKEFTRSRGIYYESSRSIRSYNSMLERYKKVVSSYDFTTLEDYILTEERIREWVAFYVKDNNSVGVVQYTLLLYEVGEVVPLNKELSFFDEAMTSAIDLSSSTTLVAKLNLIVEYFKDKPSNWWEYKEVAEEYEYTYALFLEAIKHITTNFNEKVVVKDVKRYFSNDKYDEIQEYMVRQQRGYTLNATTYDDDPDPTDLIIRLWNTVEPPFLSNKGVRFYAWYINWLICGERSIQEASMEFKTNYYSDKLKIVQGSIHLKPIHTFAFLHSIIESFGGTYDLSNTTFNDQLTTAFNTLNDEDKSSVYKYSISYGGYSGMATLFAIDGVWELWTYIMYIMYYAITLPYYSSK